MLARSLLVGESLAIQNIFNTIEKVAQVDSTVLITGESGTGKELVARAIHEGSARASKPLVTVNCGAIPADLLEAELFGHVKGAFTGATQDRQGRFQLANGGTLFLDEVGELPLHLQVKMLRVLQTRSFEPVGSSQTVSVDVRIISAANRDLEDAVQKKEFREDLYYRLNVIPVKIPSLRERKSDIPMLVNHFIAQINQRNNHAVEPISGDVMNALISHDWPGNIRELENLMERLVIMKGAGAITIADLPQNISQGKNSLASALSGANAASGATSALGEWEFPRMSLPNTGLDLKAIVDAFENHLIDQALARTSNNKNRASELLQMNRTTLVEKLRKRGMITPATKRGRDGENNPSSSQNSDF